MSSFYSRNKRDHDEELAKLEQKRYEDLLSQERIKRKNILSTFKISIEGSNFSNEKISISHIDDKPSEETKVAKDDQKIILSVNQSPIESSKNKEPKSFSSEHRLPKLKNASNSSSRMKKMQETELKKLNKELNALEEEEAEIESSLQKIDLQAYKRKVISSLQTISEDTREMEESLGKVNLLLISNKDQIDMHNEEQIYSKNLNLASDIKTPVINNLYQDVANTDSQNKEKKRNNDRIKPAEMYGKRIIYSNLSAPQTPESINQVIKTPRRITTQSVHSANAKKEIKAYSSNHGIVGRVKKARFASRDIIRVNPNIDIKSLLLS
ncbi:hypothetical protein SteCoe_742 [Stentor coeruleus]|uniref:Uncharacterized protein n=1 Tax=Stentor coeruleus TaxID=5963 RepID=A0A1R2D3J5_9CILI|nr:hypothetical protein SteCoe_742 [Stentor coeruleus]